MVAKRPNDPSRYVRIENNFPGCAEVISLSDKAFRLLVTLICISGANGQRGRIAAVQVKRFGKPSVVRELLATTILTPEGESGWYQIQDRWPTAIKWPPHAQSRPPIPYDLRRRVYVRDGFECVQCGSRKDLTLDHIHPYSRGGEDTYENFQTLCRPCNSRKGAKVYADSINQT